MYAAGLLCYVEFQAWGAGFAMGGCVLRCALAITYVLLSEVFAFYLRVKCWLIGYCGVGICML